MQHRKVPSDASSTDQSWVKSMIGGTNLIRSIFSEPLHFHILEFFHAAALHFSKYDELSGPDLICSNPRMAKSEWDPTFSCCTYGLPGSEWPWIGTVAVTVAVAVAAPSTISGCWGSSWLGKQSPPLAQPFAGGKCALLSLMGQD